MTRNDAVSVTILVEIQYIVTATFYPGPNGDLSMWRRKYRLHKEDAGFRCNHSLTFPLLVCFQNVNSSRRRREKAAVPLVLSPIKSEVDTNSCEQLIVSGVGSFSRNEINIKS